jgi:hypothetical protein
MSSTLPSPGVVMFRFRGVVLVLSSVSHRERDPMLLASETLQP